MEESLPGMKGCVKRQHMGPCRIPLSGNGESKCPREVVQEETPAQAEGREARVAQAG